MDEDYFYSSVDMQEAYDRGVQVAQEGLQVRELTAHQSGFWKGLVTGLSVGLVTILITWILFG